jgi:hypothetical protein
MAKSSVPPPPLVPAGAGELALTQSQGMMLRGVIPILLVGVLLPLGLILGFLVLREAPLRGAVENGELFLAAANTAFAGCVVLVSSRTDKLLSSMITSFVTVAFIVVPCYAFWAGLTVQEVTHGRFSSAFAIVGGGSYAVVAILVALVFVWVSS